MKKILIIPALILAAIVRVVFHIAELALYVPYAMVKRVADWAGAILKMLIEGGSYAKAKKNNPARSLGKLHQASLKRSDYVKSGPTAAKGFPASMGSRGPVMIMHPCKEPTK